MYMTIKKQMLLKDYVYKLYWQEKKRITDFDMKFCIVCAGTILKESTCLIKHITTEKSGLCQYAECITQNTTLKK